MKRFLKGLVAGFIAALIVEVLIVVICILGGSTLQQAVLVGIILIGWIILLCLSVGLIMLLIEWAID